MLFRGSSDHGACGRGRERHRRPAERRRAGGGVRLSRAPDRADAGLRGIDGWLLLFLVGCVAASLFYLVVLAHDEFVAIARESRFGESRSLLERINAWGFALPGVVIPLLIVWRMVVARRWRTIVSVLAAIWLLFLGVPLIDLGIAVARVGWGVVAANIGLFVHHAGPGIVVALGASLYLLGSRRVAATYQRLGDVDRVFD